MKINFVEAKSIITKSNIPEIDFVINPYIGCQHGCIYCYAEFMKRFTNHGGDVWGKFLDVKQVDLEKIKPEKYDGKTILISSVTDPYTPLELKYKNTRRILEKLISTKAKISILTKSKFVTRDIDLFEQFENIEIGISINTLDTVFASKIEPIASKPHERIETIKEISDHGLKTYVFISPIFPLITNYKAIISKTEKFTYRYNFENLNFRPHNIPRIHKIIEKEHPELLVQYRVLKDDHLFWDKLETEIKQYCSQKKLNFEIEFHHGGFSKS